MSWQVFQGLNIPASQGAPIKRRYSVTADVLSYLAATVLLFGVALIGRQRQLAQ